MATQTPPVEPITADPVIVEAADAQNPTATEAKQQTDEKARDNEDSKYLSDGEVGPRRRRHINYSRRVRSPGTPSPPPFRRRGSHCDEEQQIILRNSNSINKILDESDVYVEIGTRYVKTAYITNHSFHRKDIDNIAWLFTTGIVDAWVQKPFSYLPSSGFMYNLPPPGGPGRRYNAYDDRDDDFEGGATAVAHLGAALRIFKDDSNESETSKVKFVMAVQGRNSAGWAKLMICHSRQATLTAIFLEMLNRNSVLFVGAVLEDAVIPVGPPSHYRVMKFEKATSVQELEDAEEGVIKIIC